MTNDLCFYLAGLPGAGKSTIGKYVSKYLSIPILDKDDYLESLFETRGVGDAGWRQKLSREADVLFRKDAESVNRVVLVSHWRPIKLKVDYGTPCDWITDRFSTVIEIYCECSVEVAAQRFRRRVRHTGHVDNSRTTSEIGVWLREYATHLPIDAERCFVINSEDNKWEKTIREFVQKYS